MIRIVVLIALVLSSAVIAQPEIELNVKLDPPEIRQGGTKLDPDDIKQFNIYRVDGDVLTPLLPPLIFDGSEVEGAVMSPVDQAAGIVTVCAKTVDKLLLETSVCSESFEVPYIVPPPAAPGGLTVEQINDININLNININVTGEQ